jgi:hypothetical protein
MSLSVSIVMLSRCCRTVADDWVEGVGDEGGGVGVDEDVADKLGPGDGSLDEISDGVIDEDEEDDPEGQDGSLGSDRRSVVSTSISVSNRLKSSSE